MNFFLLFILISKISEETLNPVPLLNYCLHIDKLGNLTETQIFLELKTFIVQGYNNTGYFII